MLPHFQSPVIRYYRIDPPKVLPYLLFYLHGLPPLQLGDLPLYVCDEPTVQKLLDGSNSLLSSADAQGLFDEVSKALL